MYILSINQERAGLQKSINENKKMEIKGLLQQEGCPICRICDENLERGWFWFFHEAYGEGSGVSKYIDYWGFCKDHTRMVAKIGPKWQKSVIYSWTIKAKLPKMELLGKAIEDLSQRSNLVEKAMAQRTITKAAAQVKPKGECLFCESAAQTAHHYIGDLLETLADVEIQQLYKKSAGLCMQHFFQVLDDFDPKRAPQLLEVVKVQVERLNELKTDLEEFFRKVDYRFSNEPKGREQVAWIRAMERFVGEVYLGVEHESIEKSVGAVIFFKRGDRIEYLLLKQKRGHWEFPKGHIEKGERDVDTVLREIKEETGLCEVKLIPRFTKSIEYVYNKERERVYKQVTFYLAETTATEVKLSVEHLEFSWLPYEKALACVTHENARKVLREVNTFLAGQQDT